MPTPDWTKIVSVSVVPVVIISACGLLCLAFYNRLAAIVSRLRTFQRERLHEQEALGSAESQDSPEAIRHRKVMQNLEFQTAHVMRRARLIRFTLALLLLTILFLIGCSMLLGLSVLVPKAIVPAIVLFIIGLLTMFLATITALIELKAALEPANLESQFVSSILHPASAESVDSA